MLYLIQSIQVNEGQSQLTEVNLSQLSYVHQSIFKSIYWTIGPSVCWSMGPSVETTYDIDEAMDKKGLL